MLNIGFGLVRMKIAALVVGPVGVGRIGLLQNILNVASTLGGLNIGTAGARQMITDQSHDGNPALGEARQAIFITVVFLAIFSAAIFWFIRGVLAQEILGDRTQGDQLGLLTLAIAATVATGYQTAVLTAVRRIGDLARISVLSAALTVLAGSCAIIFFRDRGILLFVLAAPLATFAFGWAYLRKIPRRRRALDQATFLRNAQEIFRLGAALTASVAASLVGQLIIRSSIAHQLGPTALGHFQAVWTITYTYLLFIFQAMGSDYLPRLTAVAEDRSGATQLINEQTDAALLLAAPALLLMLGLSPWILSLLYSSQFKDGAAYLKWQVLGDLMRLGSWPVSFMLLARGAARAFSFCEISGTVIFVASTLLLLPALKLSAPGVAYVLMNVYYWCAVLLLSRKYLEAYAPLSLVVEFLSLATSCFAIFVVSLFSPETAMGMSLVGALAWSSFALYRFRDRGYHSKG